MNILGIDEAQIRQLGAETHAMLMGGKLDAAHEMLMATIHGLVEKSRDLTLQVLKLQKERVGKRSEKLDGGQLQIMFEELCRQAVPEVRPDAAVEDREDADLERELDEAKRQHQARHPRRKRRGKAMTTRKVETVVHQVPIEENDGMCIKHGIPKVRFGVDVSVETKWVPGHFENHEYHREKAACPKCKDGITTAPGPVKVIERSDASASLLAQVVVGKFEDHSPLHRQHRIFLRSGVEIPVSTLSDWVNEVGLILVPVANAIGQRMLAAYVVRADATGVRVLDGESPENIERGTMTCYVGDDKWVRFHYTPTGEGALGPWKVLAGRCGYVQADAANVFDRLFNGRCASCMEVGCNGHARRRFVELRDTDVRVAYPLRLYRRLYRIERLAKLKELSPDKVAALRRERSQPILERLRDWLESVLRREPPRSALAQACRYMVNHWEALTRFITDGRLDADNNHCERQLRAIALGRKNYLFFGSHPAAERGAAIYSVLRTCALHGVEPVAYLTDVLQKLAEGWPSDRMQELLPDRWQAAEAHP